MPMMAEPTKANRKTITTTKVPAVYITIHSPSNVSLNNSRSSKSHSVSIRLRRNSNNRSVSTRLRRNNSSSNANTKHRSSNSNKRRVNTKPRNNKLPNNIMMVEAVRAEAVSLHLPVAVAAVEAPAVAEDLSAVAEDDKPIHFSKAPCTHGAFFWVNYFETILCRYIQE